MGGGLFTVFVLSVLEKEIDMELGAGSGQIRGFVLKTVCTGALVTH